MAQVMKPQKKPGMMDQAAQGLEIFNAVSSMGGKKDGPAPVESGKKVSTTESANQQQGSGAMNRRRNKFGGVA